LLPWNAVFQLHNDSTSISFCGQYRDQRPSRSGGRASANDSVTHIETWNTLRAVASRSDFLRVADSKLRSFDNLDYIHRAGGRFVTVMPRSRHEDGPSRVLRVERDRAGLSKQILRLFSLAERHTLIRGNRIAQVFPAEPTDMQRQVLELLGVPEDAFRG
jgi:hypothetical protein